MKKLRNIIKRCWEIGAIQRSISPWASPVVLVQKKDGGLRFCIDRKFDNKNNQGCAEST